MNFNHNRVLLSVKPHSLTRIPFAMLFFFFMYADLHIRYNPQLIVTFFPELY